MPLQTYLRREGQLFVGEQSAWGTLKFPVPTEAMIFDKISIEYDDESEARTDVFGTRSEGATIIGRRSAKWSISGFFLPSGSAGVLMDASPILKGIFGTETVGADVQYAFEKDLETVFNGLTIFHFGGHMMTGAVNCIVNELSFTGSGGAHATFEASGEATTVVYAGTSTVPLGAASAATTFDVLAGDGPKYSKDAHVDIGTDTNRTISLVTGDTIVFAPALSGILATNAVIKPHQPTGITTGQVVTKTEGSFSLGGKTIKLLSGSVKISDPSKIRNDEFGDGIATGFDSIGQRQVTFEMSMRLRKDNFEQYGHAVLKTKQALVFTIGSVAGRRLRLDMPAAEITIPSIESPDDSPSTIQISGVAKPTANENELVATLD